MTRALLTCLRLCRVLLCRPSAVQLACPSQEQRPHAILKPMGYPDFTTRRRTVVAGKQQWVGKAWVGGGVYRAIVRVELSLDNGSTWLPCKLQPRLGIFAWHRFDFNVDLAVGMYTVRCRATDSIGNRQTVELDSVSAPHTRSARSTPVPPPTLRSHSTHFRAYRAVCCLSGVW